MRFLVVDLDHPSREQKALVSRFYRGYIPTLAFLDALRQDGLQPFRRDCQPARRHLGPRGDPQESLRTLARRYALRAGPACGAPAIRLGRMRPRPLAWSRPRAPLPRREPPPSPSVGRATHAASYWELVGRQVPVQPSIAGAEALSEDSGLKLAAREVSEVTEGGRRAPRERRRRRTRARGRGRSRPSREADARRRRFPTRSDSRRC